MEQPRFGCTPYFSFSLPGFLLAIAAFLAAGIYGWSLAAGILVYLIVINLVTLAIFRRDKDIAIANRTLPDKLKGARVPEVVLWGMVALGGEAGGLFGMHGFKEGHKTGPDKLYFRLVIWLIILLHLTLLVVLLFGVEFGHQ